jgi:MoaA/NifB/PqqE/SkfB family radical SAM enzyme
MSPEELKQKYELVCFEDLANYYSKHRAIFDLFKSCRREEFSGNQRLILYSSENPSQEFLNHIQRAAARIDISNFFILIVTPFDILSKLTEANQKYGNDTTLINFEIGDIENSQPFGTAGFFSNHETMCVYPFIAQDITSTGLVGPCCKFTSKVGSLKDNTVTEIFNNDAMTGIRKSMVAGQKIKECHICWDAEKNNLTSVRQHGLNKYKDRLDQFWFDDIKIRTLGWSTSNLCNFTCRICYPRSSSSIAVEELKHTTSPSERKMLKQLININNDDFTKSFPAQIIDSLADVEFLHIIGGEPFMWPGLQQLLDLIIDRDYANNIRLVFNSNASIYPATLIDKLKKFKHVEIMLSIDDIGERFELQRGGKWDNICKNIELFRALKSATIDVKIVITINIQNVLYLDQTVEFLQNLNFEIVWCYLEEPEYLAVHRTTKKVKDLIYQKYHSHPELELRNLAVGVQLSPATSGEEFLEYMSKLDNRRSQDFKLAHIEMFNAMSE